MRRAFPYLGGWFLTLGILSLLASRFLGIDVLFVPMAFAGIAAVFMVQIQRLWSKDLELTSNLNRIALATASPDDGDPNQRLMSGLRDRKSTRLNSSH